MITARYYSQLYGLDLAVNPVEVDEGYLLYPSDEEWFWIEREDVSEERGVSGNQGLACFRLETSWETDDFDYGVVAGEVWDEARAKAADAVLALRLHKAGDVLDPWLVGSALVTPHDGFVSRRVGRYRQWEPEVPGSERYLLEEGDVGAVQRLAERCRRYRDGPENFSTTLALENFGLSYGPWLSDADRLTMLFAAVEGVFGGFRDADPSGVPLAERAAMAAGGRTGPDPDAAKFWAGPVRRLRNQVAHGAASDGGNGEDGGASAVEAIRSTLRAALAAYLAWCLAVGDGAVLPATSSPRDGFNAALVAASGGDADLAAVLWPPG